MVSTDKYTWSQGRFVWAFSRLADMKAPVFTDGQRREFLKLAKSGRDFLEAHCLVGPDDWRCVFLLDRQGNPKEVASGQPLDLSIYADLLWSWVWQYAIAANDGSAYTFAKKLFDSIIKRVESGHFHTALSIIFTIPGSRHSHDSQRYHQGSGFSCSII